MQRMRFLRKKQTAFRRPMSGRAAGARRSASHASLLTFFAGRVGSIATGPASLLSGIRGSIHAKGLVFWAAALVTGILCVWQHVHAAHLAADIESLRDRRGCLKAEIGFLKMDCVTLSSRERIERYAMEQLDMRYPERDEVVRLGDVSAQVIDDGDYVMREERDQTGG